MGSQHHRRRWAGCRRATPSTGRRCTCGGATSGGCPPATPTATTPRTTRPGLDSLGLDPANVHRVAGPDTQRLGRGAAHGSTARTCTGPAAACSTSWCSASVPTATSPRSSRTTRPRSATRLPGRRRARLPQAAARRGCRSPASASSARREVWFLVERGRQGRCRAARGPGAPSRPPPPRTCTESSAPCGWSTPKRPPTWSAEHHGSVSTGCSAATTTRSGPTTTRTPSAARPATRPRASNRSRRSASAGSPPTRRRPWPPCGEGYAGHGIDPADLESIAAAYDRALDAHDDDHDSASVVELLGTAVGDHLVAAGGYRVGRRDRPVRHRPRGRATPARRAGGDPDARRRALDGARTRLGPRRRRPPGRRRPHLSATG